MSKVLMFFMNLALKILIGGAMYLIAIWINAPEWLVIALTAYGVESTKITYREK